MKSRFLLIIILGVFLLLPKGVFAQEYTFEIGNGKQWNESNIDQLSDLIYELQDQDMYDNKIDNKYILNFADGNYDYTDFSLCEFGFFEYNFGSGNYKIHSIIGEMLGSVICIGKGIEKTHLQLNSFSEEIIVIFDNSTYPIISSEKLFN